jgi:signal recognition particle subunit SRP54
VGLQGSGKTTTCAKLARWLDKQGKRPLLVAADMQRPAAVEQLKILGEQIGVPVFNVPGATPLEICRQGLAAAREAKHDVVVFDTAGRLAIDETLMTELADIKAAVAPQNVLLVVDAMIGQDAVKTSKAFHDRLGLSGVVLTKLDGDARGGAALSIREVTGSPVRFVGVGETLDKLEEFRADGMASRVLGMGDVVGLMKDFQEVVDEKDAAEKAMKMLEGQFTLDDFLEQIRMIQKMGSLKDLIAKMPGMGDIRVEAIIQSLTKLERRDPYALIREESRVVRIAKGSGQPEAQVKELVQKFLFMKQMMDGMGANLGMMGRIPGMKNVAMAKQLRKQMAQGGMPGMGGLGMPGMGMPGMGGFGMPGMGMPGMMPGGGESMTKMRPLSTAEKNARKAARKREKDARKKNRR